MDTATSESSTNNGLVPAARIASVLGRSKRGVQLALRGVPPSGQIFVRGQITDAWSITCLPSRYRSELDAIAYKGGYRDCYHLLQHPARRFAPRDAAGRDTPLSEISESCIARAFRLRSALEPALRQILQEGKYDGLALQHYRREFGNVSQRHFRRLIKRTLQRDAGQERFYDLALYFDEAVTRNRKGIPIASTAEDRTLLDALNRVKNPSKPTADETALLWAVSCELVTEAVSDGKKQKRAQRRVLDLLTGSGIAIARTSEALRKNFKLKYKRWLAGGQNLTALQDKRPISSGHHRAPEISQPDRLKLIGHARINCSGDISRAWRELMQAGELSADLTSYYLTNSSSKSYVPHAIRASISNDVRLLDAYHHGPREHKLRGA